MNTSNQTQQGRREFLILAGSAVGGVGAASALWPLVHSMNPSADVLALSTIEVDLKPIQPGQAITVMYRGKPLFVRHRTSEEIQQAEQADGVNLPDPQKDKDRVKKPEWLVVVGVCTHLGCVPTGQKSTEARGEFGGWFCPCHGSEYDTSGRIRRGPAPKNLDVPPYTFVSETVIRVGQEA